MKNEQTIVRNVEFIYEFPLTNIDLELIHIFQESLFVVEQNRSKRILALINCYLNITATRLTIENYKAESWIEQFVGALMSSQFWQAGDFTRSNAIRIFGQMLENAGISAVVRPDLSTKYRQTNIAKICTNRFNELTLNAEAVWLWSGWRSVNRAGHVFWLPLLPFYKRFGRSFVEKLYHACDTYYSGQRHDSIMGLSQLGEFILTLPTISKDNLTSSAFITTFWRNFLRYYMESEYAKGRRVNYLARIWRNNFSRFVNHCLIPSGLFAKPFGELVTPPSSVARLSPANIRLDSNGQSVNCKLLTYIPLYVTDTEAMEMLFQQIKTDVEFVNRWATIKVESLWKKYLRRKSYSKVTTKNLDIEKAMCEQIGENSDREKNIRLSAAKFETQGFLLGKECHQRAYALGFNDVAVELGLPINGSLFPHCSLLTLHHPQITPSFLVNLELFDCSGALVGFVQDGNSCYLNGAKLRKGASHAQQIILLNEITTKIVQQIILITECIRIYLKHRGDDSWRYLLLSSGAALAYPRRILNLATETSDYRRTVVLANDISRTCNISIQTAKEFVQRFSLTTLRASCGVLVYLETNDAKKMSEALGHTHYDGRLLKHYLPKSIQEFFQQRWIRIFQTGLIIVALNESKYLLKASGFSSIKELDAFLKNHALKLSPDELQQLEFDTNSPREEVIFGVDTAILSILLSLKAAVAKAKKPVNATSQYWAKIASYIESYISGPLCSRNDLKGFLKNARLNASAKELMNLIYE